MSCELLYMKTFIKMSGNANQSVAGFHSWGFMERGII